MNDCLPFLSVSQAYDFTKVGDYNVEAQNLFYYQDASGSPVPLYADVDSTYSAKLSGSTISTSLSKRKAEAISKRQASKTMYRRGGTLQKREAFTRCSGDQEGDITRVLPLVKDYVDGSIQYLQTLTSGTPRFENWFGMLFFLSYTIGVSYSLQTGTYIPDRQSVVLDHYTLIREDDPTTYTYDCQCGVYDGTPREDGIFGRFLSSFSSSEILSNPLTSLCQHSHTQGRQSLRSILEGSRLWN
jgi:hypothetical protein